MRYSLLSQFQGALWGAVLGDELGCYAQARSHQQAIPTSPRQIVQVSLSGWRPGTPLLWNNLISPSPWAELALRSTKALLHRDRRLFKLEPTLAPLLLSSGELALATLPVTLFFHNDAIALRQQLHQTVQMWQPASFEASNSEASNSEAGSLQAGSLAIAYAVTQALTEQLQPSSLIPKTVIFLQQDGISSSADLSGIADLIDQLEQVQRRLQEGSSLQSTVIEVFQPGRLAANQAIALAFYCFLSTPADFRLSLLQAARIVTTTPIVTALTGTLSGAFNSVAGLPLAWRMTESRATHLGSGKEIEQLATQLLAVWSGALDPTQFTEMTAIAAPGVIRPS